MKISQFLFFSLLLFWIGAPLIAQQTTPDSESKWAISLQTGLQASKYHNPFYFNIICIEGCKPVAVHWKAVTTVDLGLQYHLGRSYWLRLGAAYSEYGYTEDIDDLLVINGGFSREINFQFFATELAFGWEFVRWNRLSLFTENGIRLETPIDDDFDELKAVNWSYQGRIGGQYDLNQTISLRVNANFKTALGRYNREEVRFDIYNNYFPFAMGGELGVLIRL